MSQKKLRPLGDRILVERDAEETKTAGGIIIPDNAKEKPVQATVIAVGTGKVCQNGTIRPLEIAAGNKVIIGKYSGTEIKFEGKDYLILKEDEVLGVIQ